MNERKKKEKILKSLDTKNQQLNVRTSEPQCYRIEHCPLVQLTNVEFYLKSNEERN